MRQQICVASVNCLELPADGHFAWDVRWQGLKSLRENDHHEIESRRDG
jgi:hypothetical protein